MRRLSTDQFINDTLHRLISMGWTEVRNSRHIRLRSPDGKLIVTAPKTPSDQRSSANWHAQLKRLGIRL